jgi:outer membrane lipopolysaccharide assembly protein LptE/RlpB
MDAAIGFLFILLIMAMVLLASACGYKYRAKISKWLETPGMSNDEVKTRKIFLERKIEDCEIELEKITGAGKVGK